MVDVGKLLVMLLVGGCMEAMACERGHDSAVLAFLAEHEDGHLGGLAALVLGTVEAAQAEVDRHIKAITLDGAPRGWPGKERAALQALEDAEPVPMVFLRREPPGAVTIGPAPDGWCVRAFAIDGRMVSGPHLAASWRAAVRLAVEIGADPLTAERAKKLKPF